MREVAALDEHRPQEGSAKRRDAGDPSQLLHGEIHVLERHHRGGEETLWRRGAEIGDPVVVGARERVGNVGVADEVEPSANQVG